MVTFSIITVCYNAIDTIEDTIKSVICQDYKQFEYLIIDGASTDGTLDIIKRYANLDDRIHYVSEKDTGLYNAMNKGVALATGDLLEFLNSGDVLYSEEVLSHIAKKYEMVRYHNPGSKKIILYGNIVYVNPDKSEDVRMYGKMCGKAIYYATGDCVNHQSCFASRSCFKDDINEQGAGCAVAFDDSTYKICADRDWMMRQTRANALWEPLGEVVAKYSLDEMSVSVKDKDLLRREERICMKRHYPLMYPIYLTFDACRNNRLLAKLLHAVYKILYIRK